MLQDNLAETMGTKILFYHGEDGLKQLFWNETKASSEVLGILFENIQIVFTD